MAQTTFKILSDALYAELKSHAIDEALANLPSVSAAEKKRITDDMEIKSKKFCAAIAAAMMRYMVASSGAYPVLYCKIPGLTAIDDVSQIGISTQTTIGE